MLYVKFYLRRAEEFLWRPLVWLMVAFFWLALKLNVSWSTSVLRKWETCPDWWCWVVSHNLQAALAKANHLQRCICGELLWPGEFHDCVGDYPAEDEDWPDEEPREVNLGDSPGGLKVYE